MSKATYHDQILIKFIFTLSETRAIGSPEQWKSTRPWESFAYSSGLPMLSGAHALLRAIISKDPQSTDGSTLRLSEYQPHYSPPFTLVMPTPIWHGTSWHHHRLPRPRLDEEVQNKTKLLLLFILLLSILDVIIFCFVQLWTIPVLSQNFYERFKCYFMSIRSTKT